MTSFSLPIITNAVDFLNLRFTLGKLQRFKGKNPPIEHFQIPLRLKDENAFEKDVLIITPPFEGPPVQIFNNDDGTRNRSSILVPKDACPWLEELFTFIITATFNQLLSIVRLNGDKIPPACKPLLSPNVRMEEQVKQFFPDDSSGCWLKLHPQCKMYNLSTNSEVMNMEGIHRATYKILINVRHLTLGMQGQQSSACCGYIPIVQQIAFMPAADTTPTSLVIPIDEFFPASDTLNQAMEVSTSNKEDMGSSKKRKSVNPLESNAPKRKIPSKQKGKTVNPNQVDLMEFYDEVRGMEPLF